MHWRRHLRRTAVSGVRNLRRGHQGGRDQSSRRRPRLADDRADAAEDRLRHAGRGVAPREGHRCHPRHQLGVKPFSMALLGWIFVRHVFARWLPAGQIDSYIAGLILLAAAPCTAMVFVWSNLANGEPNCVAGRVQRCGDVVLAPLVVRFCRPARASRCLHARISVAYIVVSSSTRPPVAPADAGARAGAPGRGLSTTLAPKISPVSLSALLATLVLLFSFQGRQIVAQPLTHRNSRSRLIRSTSSRSRVLAGPAAWRRVPRCRPSALIGASNFFELAIAVAIAVFGIESGEAFATVVGVLIEVPVMICWSTSHFTSSASIS